MSDEIKIVKAKFTPYLESASTLEQAVVGCIDMQAQDKIKDLKLEIENIQAQLKDAIEVLKMYGDKNSWHTNLATNKIFISAGDWELEGTSQVGGKAARQFLKRLGVKE
jgi:hypothetical protein